MEIKLNSGSIFKNEKKSDKAPDYKGKVVLRESDEWYDSEGRARLAAIGHISLLENGEG